MVLRGILGFLAVSRRRSSVRAIKLEKQKAVRLLNGRPRKRLNFLTPYEVFNQRTECCILE